MPRLSKTDEITSTVSLVEPVPPVQLERGATITLHVTVLRIDQIWVTFSFAGEMVRVLRSRLEKELNDAC